MFSHKRTKLSNPSCSALSISLLSAETIANNEYLLTQILLRLPIKLLLKFKCVSKQWLSLISSPHFAHSLTPRINSPSALFVPNFSKNFYPEYDFISLDPDHSSAPFKVLNFVNHNTTGIKIIRSCNGLMLCHTFGTHISNRKYYVYNPTTKQYTVLPPLRSASNVVGLSLAFDPLKSPYYTVICVRQSDNRRRQYRYQIDIYTSKGGSWMNSTCGSFTSSIFVRFAGGVYWNGAVHWISDWGSSWYFLIDQQQLRKLSLHPLSEDWESLEDWELARNIEYFGESGGHLILIESYPAPLTQFDVYEMCSDYSRWMVKHRIDLEGVKCIDNINYVVEILYFVTAESEDESFMVLHVPGQFIRYDIKNGSIKKLCDFPSDLCSNRRTRGFSLFSCTAHEYFESFASV